MVMPPLFMHRSLVSALSTALPVNYDFKLDFSVYMAKEKEEEESEEIREVKIEDIVLSKEEYEKIDKNASYKYVNPLSKIPKKISVSELKDVLSEGEYYKGSETRSIYIPDFLGETNITASERGTLIHYIFEKIDLDKIRNSDNKLSVILDFVENNEYLKERLTLTDLKKAEAFFSHPMGIKMLRSSEIFREKEFLIRMKAKYIYKELDDTEESIIIQGIIDCLFVDTKGDVYLLDYKYVSKSEEEIRKTYTYQLELYREAVSKMLKISKDKINTYIWNVRDEYLIDF
jgi:ATP-dependent helicase/nuclease subunit A